MTTSLQLHSNIEVEIRLTSNYNANINKEELIQQIKMIIPGTVNNSQAFSPDKRSNIAEKVDRIFISCPTEPEGMCLNNLTQWLDSAKFYFYNAKNFGAMPEDLSLDQDSNDSAIGSYQWELPSVEFDGLWETLVYEFRNCPKNQILNYIMTLMKMTESGVNPKIVLQNRLILLNGPPGTGKTTLCKAIAQKIAIRMNGLYKSTLLVEVNSHSLFSKWFSESGKLIQKLFTRIEELAERSDWLIFVLIDEIESLTMGREAAISGTDPTDSVRAVNAVLTQLDKLKRFTNVFMLCTSNLDKALDSAFIDRIGLIQRIGNPSSESIASIFNTCVNELRRAGCLTDLLEPEYNNKWTEEKFKEISRSCALAQISGRSLRKLPIRAFSLATAKNYNTSVGARSENPLTIPINIFLDCLLKEAENEKNRTLKVENTEDKENENGMFNFSALRNNLPTKINTSFLPLNNNAEF